MTNLTNLYLSRGRLKNNWVFNPDLVSPTPLKECLLDRPLYPDVKNQIEIWKETVNKAEWQNLEEIRKIYRDAEAVGNFTVFNIKGNDYRSIARD